MSFDITVTEVNTAPTLAAIGNQTVDEGATLSFTASATDDDLDPGRRHTLTYSLNQAALDAGMTINSATGAFSFSPTEAQGGITYTGVTITVSDGNAGTDSVSFDITVTEVNTAPTLAAIGNQTVDEGATLSFTASATDDDVPADTLTYSLNQAALDAGMTINSATGAFSFSPTEAQGGITYTGVTITVSDGNDGTDSVSFDITVTEVNTAPTLAAIGNQTVDEGATLSFTASATDDDVPADTLTYSLNQAALDAGMTINSATGAFSFSPTEAQGGITYTGVTITVSDGNDGTDSVSFDITVTEVNTAPTLAAIGNQTVDEGATLSFTASATDDDVPADTLTYSLNQAALDAGMTINSATGAFSFSPTEAQGGITYTGVTITVSDGNDGTDSVSFDITVTEVNTAPTLAAIGNQTVDEGATLSFTASATDDDVPADTLTYSLNQAALDAGMTINSATGAFSFSPTEAQGGITYTGVTITVSDGNDGTDSVSFDITVTEVNTAPTLAAIGNQTVDEGATLSFTASATDDDVPADTLTYSLNQAALDAGMTINSATGAFSFSPTEAQGGITYTGVTITVSDGNDGTDSVSFDITVTEVNTAPTLAAIGNQTVDEGATLSFTASATDDDVPADTLTYSLNQAALDAGMTINSATGAFSFSPTEAQGGITYTGVTITVSDGNDGTDSVSFDITVTEVNTAPTLAAIGNQTVDEGATLSFTASATDDDVPADTLTYSLNQAALDAGMTINSATGAFSFSPTEAQGGITYTGVTITVSDGNDGTDSVSFDITVTEVNTAPTLAAIGNQTVDEGATLSFTASATDDDVPADTLTYSLNQAALDAGMTINSATGAFSFSPTEAQGGITYTGVTITVSDGNDGTDSVSFDITVTEVNTAPTLAAIGNQTVDEGATLSFTASATDDDVPADTLTYSLNQAALDAGMTINSATGAFSFSPTEAQGGITYTGVTITVSDGNDGTDSVSFDITVTEVNTAPTLAAIGNQTVDEGATLSFTASATDDDVPADTLTYSLNQAALDAGMTINSATGAFSFSPTEAQGGITYTGVTITVSDGNDGTDSVSFDITVTEVNTAPTLAAIGNQTVDEGATLSFTASATDDDVPADTLTYSLNQAALDAGMTINSATGAFSFSPTEAQGGITYTGVTITVSDGNDGTDSVSFDITVTEVNTAPTLAAIGNQTVDEGATLSFTASATDDDVPADTLTYSLNQAALDAGMTINSATGAFSFSPTEAQGGITYTGVTITVSDGNDGTDSVSFDITVTEVNTAPTLAAIGNQTVDEGATLSFTASATDDDVPADTLTYSLNQAALDAGMTINSATGAFSFSPTEAQGGITYTGVTITVSDGNDGTDSVSFDITVTEVNTAPTLAAIGNQTVDEGATLSFTASATDDDVPADTLTYSLNQAALDAGMTINSATGAFSFSPTEAQGGITYTGVTITVSDGNDGTDSVSFDITVTEVNTAPTLAAIGNQTVDEGATLSFTASATDDDVPADTLTYSLNQAALDAGMTINSATGAFSFSPTEAQGGITYTGVTITVSDGNDGTDSVSFDITVTEVNTAPTLAAIGNQTVDEGATLSFTASATDDDVPADTLTYSLNQAALDAGMTINSATGAFSFSPTEAQGGITYTGVTITVSDGNDGTDSVSFDITVTEVNEAPPKAVDDTATTQGDPVKIGVLKNDVNVDGSAPQITSFTQPDNGTVTLNADNTFTYVPNQGFSGVDTFNYTIQDSGENKATATVTVTVTATAENQLASRSLTDGTEYTSSAYAGSSMDDSGSYYEGWDDADDHGSNDLEYVRAAVTESEALLENVNTDVDLTPTPANDLATGDLSVILEAPAAGEVEAAQELNEALQQEAERFEQDRKQLIETLDEVSEFLRCG